MTDGKPPSRMVGLGCVVGGTQGEYGGTVRQKMVKDFGVESKSNRKPLWVHRGNIN